MAGKHVREHGQASLMMALSSVVLFGLLGLVVDFGWANWRKEACKTAAESAAQAAVAAAKAGGSTNYTVTASTSCPSSPTNSTPAGIGCMYAQQNGFTNGSNNRSVAYQTGTTSGSPVSGVATTYWVSYTVSETLPTTFSAVLGKTATTVTARATAAIPGSASSAAGCVYVLDPNAQNAFQAGNNATISSGCGIYVKSTNATSAAWATGSAHVSVTNGSIAVGGGYKQDNAGVFSPAPLTNQTFPGDPLSSLAAPTVNTPCQAGNFTTWQATPYAISPGTYCTFQLGNGMNATLSSGTYVINGGSFSVQGGSQLTVSGGGGVLIYLTGGAYANIANGATVTLQALSTGTWQGVLFYQDRTMSNPTGSNFAGGANMDLKGTLYFPNSLVTIDNGVKANVMAFVVGRLSLQGGTTINAATSASQTGISGGSTPYVALIE